MLLDSHIHKPASELSTLDLANLPEKSPEIIFDATREISEQYWDTLLFENFIESRLERFQQHEEPKSDTALKIGAMLAIAKFLNCPKIENIQDPIGLSEYLKKFIEDRWNPFGNGLMELFQAALIMQICYPAQANLTNPHKHQTWHKLVSIIEQVTHAGRFNIVAMALLIAKMLPSASNQTELIQDYLPIIKRNLQQTSTDLQNNEKWEEYIVLSATAKILMSEDDQKDFAPDIETWKKLLAYFHGPTPGLIEHYLLPIYLKIIASEKAEITPHGLKITEKNPQKTSLSNQITPLPAIFHHRIQQI